MKKQFVLTAFFLCLGSFLFAQNEKPKMVTTIGIIDTLETKSGFRINEYYVELTRNQLDSLKGKKVSVTGKLLIIEGIDPTSKEIVQGSLNDRYFITDPEFTIVYDTREPLIQDSSPY
jgi:hypothetical protein